jgi:hypothetical protein
MKWKEYGRKGSWPGVGCYASVCLNIRKKATEGLGHFNGFTVWQLNPGTS